MNNWRCTVLLPTPEGAQNIAQRQLNIAILSATRWQNYHIFRQVLGKFLIVSTDLHPAIAPLITTNFLKAPLFTASTILSARASTCAWTKSLMISPYSIVIGGSQIIAITSKKSLCPSLLVGICFQPELPVELSVKTLSLQEAFGSGGTTQLAVKMIAP